MTNYPIPFEQEYPEAGAFLEFWVNHAPPPDTYPRRVLELLDNGVILVKEIINPGGSFRLINIFGNEWEELKESIKKEKIQGRNERCNCGSGLKFKKCCGK